MKGETKIKKELQIQTSLTSDQGYKMLAAMPIAISAVSISG